MLQIGILHRVVRLPKVKYYDHPSQFFYRLHFLSWRLSWWPASSCRFWTSVDNISHLCMAFQLMFPILFAVAKHFNDEFTSCSQECYRSVVHCVGWVALFHSHTTNPARPHWAASAPQKYFCFQVLLLLLSRNNHCFIHLPPDLSLWYNRSPSE